MTNALSIIEPLSSASSKLSKHTDLTQVMTHNSISYIYTILLLNYGTPASPSPTLSPGHPIQLRQQLPQHCAAQRMPGARDARAGPVVPQLRRQRPPRVARACARERGGATGNGQVDGEVDSVGQAGAALGEDPDGWVWKRSVRLQRPLRDTKRMVHLPL